MGGVQGRERCSVWGGLAEGCGHNYLGFAVLDLGVGCKLKRPVTIIAWFLGVVCIAGVVAVLFSSPEPKPFEVRLVHVDVEENGARNVTLAISNNTKQAELAYVDRDMMLSENNWQMGLDWSSPRPNALLSFPSRHAVTYKATLPPGVKHWQVRITCIPDPVPMVERFRAVCRKLGLSFSPKPLDQYCFQFE